MEGQARNPFFLDFSISVSDSTICYYTDVTLEAILDPEEPVGTVFEWDFGLNAVPATASGAGPHTIQYTSSGTKVVTVTATYDSLITVQTTNIVVSSCPGNITGSVKDEWGNGIAGVNVRLYADANQDGVADDAVVIRSVFTTSTGSWAMVNLTPGHYVIDCGLVNNYTLVSGIDISEDGDAVANVVTTDDIIPATVNPGEIDAGNNFVFTPNPGTISGYVFVDADADEFFDLGEGIAGAEINIYQDVNLDGIADGPAIATVFTDANGYYEATGIPAGRYALASPTQRDYIIVLTVPIGYTMVKGIDKTNDSDSLANVPDTDNIIPCSLAAGEIDSENYFIITL